MITSFFPFLQFISYPNFKSFDIPIVFIFVYYLNIKGFCHNHFSSNSQLLILIILGLNTLIIPASIFSTALRTTKFLLDCRFISGFSVFKGTGAFYLSWYLKSLTFKFRNNTWECFIWKSTILFCKCIRILFSIAYFCSNCFYDYNIKVIKYLFILN